MSEQQTYLIWSNANQAWWRANSAGYTTFISSAGRYTRDEAIKICAGCRDGWRHEKPPTEIPVQLNDVIECYVTSQNVENYSHAATPTKAGG